MKPPRLFRFPLPFAAALLAAGVVRADEGPVRFNRDIRPIFSDTCFHCHGFDPKSREAGLRLDIRDEALKKTENDVVPIVPGKPEESEIIARIFSTDRDDIMPPPKAHKELTAKQKETIKRWVAEGAVYEPHWAYAPLVKPGVPGAESGQFSVFGVQSAAAAPSAGSGPLNTEHRTLNTAPHPIDAFIHARLAEKKIAPSPEAPKAKLLRRLSLDLTGLPPTPEEVAAFIADAAPDAYEKQVDRLLASPHFGERMAVWWLDIARFTDTVGFHGDQNQRIFPYRDYVIDSFNANKGFDRFTIEQLAGDLLPNPTKEQLVATGYNRLNMMTREGGAQPKEYLAKYGAERVRAVSAAWFGSTFGCAECHDHKFDPIKTRDFYELQSFFADVKQWGVYADYGYTKNPDLAGFDNHYPFPPEIEVESPYLLAQKKRTEAELAAHLAAARERLATEEKARADFEKWIDAEARAFLQRAPEGWAAPAVSALIYKDDKPVADPEVAVGPALAVQLEKALGKGEELRLTARPDAGWIAAVRIEVLTAGLEEKKRAEGLGKTVRFAASVRGTDGKLRKLATYFGEATARQTSYSHGAEVIGLGSEWKLPKTADGGPLAAVWLLDPPLRLAPGEKLVCTLTGDNTLPLRVSVTPLAAARPLDSAGAPLRAALALPADQRTTAQRELLADTFLLSTASHRPAFDRYQELTARLRELRGGRAWSLVTEATTPLTVRVLPRGNWQDESGPVVLPATPSFLPGRRESTGERRLTRLDLAQWLVSQENPITARAVMNRLWAQFFGTGLSAVVDDLGSQGELPSHPELLDWIASEFRESGWDVKHMIRLFVTSATYRQSSSLRPELREIDPANRLLASQNPRRLEAEFVRDNALFIAGALNLELLGGPSVKPYQPAGYYAAIQFPDRDYVASTGPEQWRRGVYMHWQRSFLHPMLANFDAPARDECAAARVVSNTPQQALTLLNDPTFVEAARLFADRLLRTPAADDDARLNRACETAVARPLREKERTALKAFLISQREHFRANSADAEKLLKVGSAPPSKGDPAELAAWTSVCRVLLNSQEVLTRY